MFDIFSRASCCFSLLMFVAASCHYLLLPYAARCFKSLSSLVFSRCRLFYLLATVAFCDMFSAACRCPLTSLVIPRFPRLLRPFSAVICCSLHGLVLYDDTSFLQPAAGFATFCTVRWCSLSPPLATLYRQSWLLVAAMYRSFPHCLLRLAAAAFCIFFRHLFLLLVLPYSVACCCSLLRMCCLFPLDAVLYRGLVLLINTPYIFSPPPLVAARCPRF